MDSVVRRHRGVGFTLIEMLTTVAVLIIVLGLMVSLARYVRDQSAQQLTRELLHDLDGMMAQYQTNNRQALPPVGMILRPEDTTAADDAGLWERARRNNAQVIKALKEDYHQHRHDPGVPPDPFEKYPINVYDRERHSLRDAWGQPIVFMPKQHALIGLAPSEDRQDKSFFFSAGQDRKYLTREDNLYSYETRRTSTE